MRDDLKPISGSYQPDDCQFLLTLLPPHYTSVAEKERLIQSGQRHYSEMISEEAPPSERYRALFTQLTELYRERMAREVIAIADWIIKTRSGPLTILSLARAGTPLGALLQRALVWRGAEVAHYSISIIRDRGIDTAALSYILDVAQRPAAGVFFVDAWTAKGVITRELKAAIASWNQKQVEEGSPSRALSDELFVLSDIGGCADYAATYDDYAIPSGILNSTVSGLLSRSILNDSIEEGQFHGAVSYEHLREYDLSGWFLDQVSSLFDQVSPASPPLQTRAERAAITREWVERCLKDRVVSDLNHIKPGVAEATRVLLRRVPERLIVRDPTLEDVQHLLVLAREKRVSVEISADLPFNAVSLIKAVSLESPSGLGAHHE